MKAVHVSLALAAGVLAGAAPAPEELRTFERIQLSDQFWSEGATFGDLNNDGANDIISGPWWWEGPEFSKRHEYYPATATFDLKLGPMTTVKVPGFEGTLGRENKYSDNFFAFTHDFNADRWQDILIVGFPGAETSWYENPRGATTGHWRRHVVFERTSNESPTFTDLTGDGRPELVCITGEQYGYASPDPADPAKPWTFHPVTPRNKYQRFTHGLGVGDVDGDGRRDLLEKNGWWQQPASLEGDPVWRFHEAPMGSGGAQMHVYDVNGDGLNDVITSLDAHGFGLAWFEGLREGGRIGFRRHLIVNKDPTENPYGVKFSEIHAVALEDMDGDGLQDIVTGKRFWSHGRTGDPDRNDAAVLYWFRLVRGGAAGVDFVPYLIDAASGVGTQVVAGDVNKDGLPDVVVGNKNGTFVHLQTKKIVSRDEWEKAQPKRGSASLVPQREDRVDSARPVRGDQPGQR